MRATPTVPAATTKRARGAAANDAAASLGKVSVSVRAFETAKLKVSIQNEATKAKLAAAHREGASEIVVSMSGKNYIVDLGKMTHRKIGCEIFDSPEAQAKAAKARTGMTQALRASTAAQELKKKANAEPAIPARRHIC